MDGGLLNKQAILLICLGGRVGRGKGHSANWADTIAD